MTMLVGNLTPREGILATDTLAVNAAGETMGFVGKTFSLPHVRAAFAVTGTGYMVIMLYARLMVRPLGDGTFDDMAAGMQAALDEVGAMAERDIDAEARGRGVPLECCVTIIGWSESANRVKGYSFCNFEYAPGVEPGRLRSVLKPFGRIDMPDGYFTVPAFIPQAELSALLARFRTMAPARRIPELAKLARIHNEMADPGGSGGKLIETTITRDGIAQRITHDWAAAVVPGGKAARRA